MLDFHTCANDSAALEVYAFIEDESLVENEDTTEDSTPVEGEQTTDGSAEDPRIFEKYVT